MKKYFKIIILIISLIIFDQISKVLITNYFEVGDSLSIINNFFKFFYIKNTGAAFGIFMNSKVTLIIITLMLIVYLIIELKKNINNKVISISLSLIISGALGNLIDRIFRGYVVDFISFTIFDKEMAIFNVADTFITFGVVLLLIYLFKEGKHERSNNK